MIKRSIQFNTKRSFFLFGPRQTGKSTLINLLLEKNTLVINLLHREEFLKFEKEPTLFRQEVLTHQKKYPNSWVFVDEIQKIPTLLDEIHDLIESKKIKFILTGSSARKLKRGGANLLAGRATTYHLFPLTFQELGDEFDLEKALRYGTLPASYLSANDDAYDFLSSYVVTYLKEEIQEEGIVRNLGNFARFLDVVAANDGELVNFSNISRECSIPIKTVQSYYDILEDTLIAHRLLPWTRSVRKRLVVHPKYYLFDTGVTNQLSGTLYQKLNSVVRGRRFEQFIILETLRTITYAKSPLKLFFWRNNTGTEVDFILVRGEEPIAGIEIKSTPYPHLVDCTGLKALAEDYPRIRKIIVANVTRPYHLDDVEVIPWKTYMKTLEEDFLH